MVTRAKKHDHKYRVISMSLDPRRPSVIYMCGVQGCTDTKVVCPLCEEDGNRRRHKSHVGPKVKRDVLARSKLALTKAIIEYERLWPEGKDNMAKAMAELKARKQRND